MTSLSLMFLLDVFEIELTYYVYMLLGGSSNCHLTNFICAVHAVGWNFAQMCVHNWAELSRSVPLPNHIHFALLSDALMHALWNHMVFQVLMKFQPAKCRSDFYCILLMTAARVSCSWMPAAAHNLPFQSRGRPAAWKQQVLSTVTYHTIIRADL